jgi:beta-carotene hydroxylase
MQREAMLPDLDELGADLLTVPIWRRVLSLVSPPLLAVMFFIFAAHGMWFCALVCTMLISFLTYGSTSHDLVHQNLSLPKWLNEILLAFMELLALRSGHAYRITHLNHHAHFPGGDDLEGAAAGMSWWQACLDGPTLQIRLWMFAIRRRGGHRPWVLAEGGAVILIVTGCLLATRITIAPAIYAALMIAGSWVFPLVTSYIPHVVSHDGKLSQTRLFRGKVLSWIALEHLYHLEHHLYPKVPHHNWPKLALRLDPHFARLGIKPVKLFF